MTQYRELDHEFAMAYGDEFHAGNVTPYDWATFARHTGTARSLLAREMRRMGSAASEAAARQLNDPVYSDAERTFLDGVAAHVEAQAGKLLDMAKPMPGVEL